MLSALQGLADTFIILGMPFDSPQATQLNKEIFECIYYTALKVSCELAQEEGVQLSILTAVPLCECSRPQSRHKTAVSQVAAQLQGI